jgi:hypothetical protein
MKQDYGMNTFVELRFAMQPWQNTPFCNSTSQEKEKRQGKEQKTFETCSEEEAGLPGQYLGAVWPFHRCIMLILVQFLRKSNAYTDKKENQIFSYKRKFRRDQLQSHI